MALTAKGLKMLTLISQNGRERKKLFQDGKLDVNETLHISLFKLYTSLLVAGSTSDKLDLGKYCEQCVK